MDSWQLDRRGLCLMLGLCLPLVAAMVAGARAQPRLVPLHVRTSVAGATMLSKDQNDWLGYNAPGVVGDMQLGYSVSSWLDVRAGVGGGAFPAAHRTGGLLQPQLGAAVGWSSDGLRPYVQLDLGMGFTGALLRPAFRVSIGLDVRVSNALTLGPVLGYWQLFQHDGPKYSTDARFLWLGLVFAWQAVALEPVREPPQHRVSRPPPQVAAAAAPDALARDPQPPSAAEPAPVSAPSSELMALIETALPTQHNEWLAPVLFAFDSAKLEPQGVAMLHEVARELARRPNLRRLEIRGYADVRGGDEYNLRLSARRARAVLEWLVAHGVARERLSLAGRGATEFVEDGRDEAAHEQNRRVVFRVVDPAGVP